jgi:cell shape-determining protein MreD
MLQQVYFINSFHKTFRVSSPKAERTVKFIASLLLQEVSLLLQSWLKSFIRTLILLLSLTQENAVDPHTVGIVKGTVFGQRNCKRVG